jgi:predicted PurR-regulated permease PerM
LSNQPNPDLDQQVERLEARLPGWLARFVRWLRRPSSRLVRMPMAILLILIGVVGVFPIVGLSLIPLGLILIAQDIPFLRPPITRMLAWIEQMLEKKEAAPK